MSSTPAQDHLAAATAHLAAAFPDARDDNDVPLYQAMRQAMLDGSRDAVLAHLRAQRTVLRILTTTASNAAPAGRGHDPTGDAWWAYQDQLQNAQTRLGTLIETLGADADPRS